MSELNDVIYKLNKAKLDNYDKHYVIYSDKLSTACRQLAFSEGAVFWIFSEASYLSIWIALGLLMLVLYFCVDLFQYYYGMRDYGNIADKIRAEMHKHEVENSHNEINVANANVRLEKCFKWKLKFIFLSSVLLIFVFLEIFLFCK